MLDAQQRRAAPLLPSGWLTALPAAPPARAPPKLLRAPQLVLSPPCHYAGEPLARYSSFLPGESITALAVWDPFETGQTPTAAAARGASGAAHMPSLRDDEPAAPGARGQEDEVEGSSAPLRSHPIAFSPESPAAAAEERPWGGFIVVGTSIDQLGSEGARNVGRQWDDESSTTLQGRVLLLQLTTATVASGGGSRAAVAAGEDGAGAWGEATRRPLQLLPVAQLHLPSRVLALCPGTADLTGLTGGGSSSSRAGSRLFASVGRRLVAYEWAARQQALRRVAWVPTNRPLASLQARPHAALPHARGNAGRSCILRMREPLGAALKLGSKPDGALP